MRRLPSHFADIPPAGGEADQQQAGRVAAADAVGFPEDSAGVRVRPRHGRWR